MAGIEESLVREIVRRLVTVIDAERIILFGSAATGQMTRDSDIDVLVVGGTQSNTLETYGRLHGALRGLGFPFDVFVIPVDRFELTKNTFGGIAYPAHKFGRVLYEAVA